MISGFYYDKGDTAPVNEDALLVEQVCVDGVSVLMAAVCDGIGGLDRGEYASTLVTARLREWFYGEAIDLIHRKRKPVILQHSCMRLLYEAAAELKREGQRDGLQLGTTMTLLLIRKNQYLLFHVGDSRAFLLGRSCRQLTVDDVHENGALTRCIGAGNWQRCQITCGRWHRGQYLLLCSDGFWRKLTREDLRTGFPRHRQFSAGALNKRLQEAGCELRRRGEQDNQSAVILLHNGEGGREKRRRGITYGDDLV